MKSVPLIVVAISGNRGRKLLHHLKLIHAEVLTVESCQQVRELLAAHPVDLVITEVSLADGNWCDLIRHMVDNETPARVVVTAETPTDSLWAEVFWRGAHDLLVAPYQAQEVRHVVWSALRMTEFLTSELSLSNRWGASSLSAQMQSSGQRGPAHADHAAVGRGCFLP